jgi:hypothetical protein
MNPTARQDDILTDQLLDETIVYDLKRHKAHRLNKTAAAIWRRCDGQTTIEEITASLPQLGLPSDPTLVEYTLTKLERAHLLQEPVSPQLGGPGFSRRVMLRRLAQAGTLAVLLPVVSSITAPTPAMAASPKCIKEHNTVAPLTGEGDCPKTVKIPCCNGLKPTVAKGGCRCE